MVIINGFQCENDTIIRYIGKESTVVMPEGFEKVRGDVFSSDSESVIRKLIIPADVREMNIGSWHSAAELLYHLESAGPLGSGCDLEFGWTDAIPDRALAGSRLREIHIPSSIRSIGKETFGKEFYGSGQKTIYIEDLSAWLKLFQNREVSPFSELIGIGLGPEEMVSPEEDQNHLVLNGKPVTDLVIPDGIRFIPESAFQKCTDIRSVTLPDSVREIRWSAFRDCTGLREIHLPNDIIIRHTAFRNTPVRDEMGDWFILDHTLHEYSGREAVVRVPDGVETISVHAFYEWFRNMEHIQKLILPASLRVMKAGAVEGIYTLNILKMESMVRIEPENFVGCLPDPEEFDDTSCLLFYLCVKEHIVLDRFRDCLITKDVRALARPFEKDLELPEFAFAKERYLRLAELADIRQKQNDTAADGRTEGKLLEAQAEQFAAEYRKSHSLPEAKKLPSYMKVCYRDSMIPASPAVLQTLVGIYAKQHRERTGRSEYGYGKKNTRYSGCVLYEPDAAADYIASLLDREQLSTLLYDRLFSKDRGWYKLAFGRYACDEDIRRVLSLAGKQTDLWFRGHWSDAVLKALVLNPSWQMVLYYESKDMLDWYAAVHKIPHDEAPDRLLVPLMDLDEHGDRIYCVNGKEYRVVIMPDFSCHLYDDRKGEFVRKAVLLREEKEHRLLERTQFRYFRRTVLRYGREKMRILERMYIHREWMTKESWRTAWAESPAKPFASRIIWYDGSASFMITDNGSVTADGEIYEPGDRIIPAIAAELTEEDVERWKTYLGRHSVKQPLGQMQEPVGSRDAGFIEKICTGLKLTYQDFSLMERRIQELGFARTERNVGAYEWEITYPEAFTVICHTDVGGPLDLIRLKFHEPVNLLAANKALIMLVQGALEYGITADNEAIFVRQFLDVTDLPFLRKAVQMSIKMKAVKITAVLLDYINEKYPGFGSDDWNL